MLCVITNDDGVDAPGLRALHAALKGLAEVVVVAPAAQCSGVGHGAPPREPMLVERRADPVFGDAFVVHGKPADCTRLALVKLLDRRPDVLVSGINRGGNVGVDLYYSGTFAAAREATILGVPAISMSQLLRQDLPEDWAVTTRRARVVLERMLGLCSRGGPPGLWNVNIPHLPAGERPKGVRMAPAAIAATDLQYTVENGGDGRAIYHYCGRFFDRAAPPGTDVACLFDDWLTITPVGLDLTAPSIGTGPLDWPVE